MTPNVLKTLNEKLEARKIPSRLIEDDSILTVLFGAPVTDFDIYGDIFAANYGGDTEDGGLLVLQWEVMDITDRPDDFHANLNVALSMMNSVLPAGGYAIRVTEDDDSDTDEPSSIQLLYRIVLPVGLIADEEWLADEAYDAVELSAAVLKSTAKALMDFADNRMSEKEFMDLIS